MKSAMASVAWQNWERCYDCKKNPPKIGEELGDFEYNYSVLGRKIIVCNIGF
jgi:hypothetical protein